MDFIDKRKSCKLFEKAISNLKNVCAFKCVYLWGIFKTMRKTPTSSPAYCLDIHFRFPSFWPSSGTYGKHHIISLAVYIHLCLMKSFFSVIEVTVWSSLGCMCTRLFSCFPFHMLEFLCAHIKSEFPQQGSVTWNYQFSRLKMQLSHMWGDMWSRENWEYTRS